LQEPAHSREGALRHTLLAATYLGQDDPEPERACHHGDRALDLLASQVDSARCAGHVLADRLAPYHRQLVVRDFVDRAHRLVGAAA
jgi:hypothetical protein